MTLATHLLAGAAAAALSAGAAFAQGAPIVQPGAPGQDSRQLSAEEAARIADNRYSADDVRFMQDMIVHHFQAVQMSAWSRIAQVIRASRPSLRALMRRRKTKSSSCKTGCVRAARMRLIRPLTWPVWITQIIPVMRVTAATTTTARWPAWRARSKWLRSPRRKAQSLTGCSCNS
jgi:hypothetical protein